MASQLNGCGQQVIINWTQIYVVNTVMTIWSDTCLAYIAYSKYFVIFLDSRVFLNGSGIFNLIIVILFRWYSGVECSVRTVIEK